MSKTPAIVVVVLASIFARLSPCSGFEWVNDPGPVISMIYPDQKSITLRWEWKFGNNEEFRWADIDRYNTIEKTNSTKNIASCYKSGNRTTTWKFDSYNLSCQLGKAGVVNGHMELTIHDVTKQNRNLFNLYGDNWVNVLAFNYSYELGLRLSYFNRNPPPKATKLIVYMRPTIKATLESKYVDSIYKDVTLNCTAEGNPKPTIIWEHKHPSGAVKTFKGEELTISKAYTDPFQLSDIGLYTCQATNNVGNASSAAVVQYTVCGSGCSSDETISIEMTNLVYTSDYDNSYSAQFIKLKHDVEVDCFNQYFKAAQNLLSCVVTGFRKGSVVVDMKITYPYVPRKPLQTAIETGMFAGQRVKTSFSPARSIPRKDSNSSSTSTNSTVIVLAVLFALSLVAILVLIFYINWKINIERKGRQERSSNSNQDQRSDIESLPPVNVLQHHDNVIYHNPQAPIVESQTTAIQFPPRPAGCF